MNARGFTWLNSPELRELGKTINNSVFVSKLRELDKDAGMLRNKKREILSDDDLGRMEYYFRDDELFSRAYAQYIATRSGNKTMTGQLEKMRSDIDFHRDRQWPDKDFEPIANAFDKILKKKELR